MGALRSSALVLLAALGACGTTDEAPPGVGEDVERDATLEVPRGREAEAQHWRGLRSRASFDPESASRSTPSALAGLSIDGLLAWSEARLAAGAPLSTELRAALALRRAPAERRALLLGYVQTGAAPEELELADALQSADPALREAAVLVCARSAARALPERVLGREVLSADERALLEESGSGSEPRWNRISGAWAEERFRAALRHGLVDGRSGRSVAEAELRSDAAFLREVAIAALPATELAALAAHVASARRGGIRADLLARLLAGAPPRVLFPGRGELDADEVALLRGALLAPSCSDETAAAVLELRERLPAGAAWRAAAQFVAGDPSAGLALRRGFSALRREDALAAVVMLGRIGRTSALAMLSELVHPSREVGLYVFGARVACGDYQPLELVFARAFAGGPSERGAALDALLATGAAQRQRAWLTERSRELPPADIARLALVWGARDPLVLLPLLAEEVAPEWGALAVERLLAGAAQIPPALASGWPRGAAWSYDRALAAMLARARAPRGTELLEDALRELDTDGALLAAAALAMSLGNERAGEIVRATLLTAGTADEQAKLGWIAGRLLGRDALAWLPSGDKSDPARDAALLGVAAREAAAQPER